MINNFLKDSESVYRGGLFMSGSGSNVEKIMEYHNDLSDSSAWKPVVIITDRPKSSRAFELGEKFSLPVVALDIGEFYRARGEKRISIMTERGCEIREEWTCELRSLLAPYELDFGILAGFVPLTNITGDFPCLNVHPGDLTVEEDGRRVLVGLHTIPIEAAILRGDTTLRSSVLVVQPYGDDSAMMDSGPVPGISAPVPVDFYGHSVEALAKCAEARPDKRPVGGYKDLLEEVAAKNQENLKEHGDWIVFPRVLEDFAAGRFGLDDDGELFYRRDGGEWKAVFTVEYGIDIKTPRFKGAAEV